MKVIIYKVYAPAYIRTPRYAVMLLNEDTGERMDMPGAVGYGFRAHEAEKTANEVAKVLGVEVIKEER